MERIQILLILHCFFVTIASAATQTQLPSTDRVQAYYAKAYSGQLTTSEVAEIAALLPHQQHQKHAVTILYRAAKSTQNTDICTAVASCFIKALPILLPRVRKDAIRLLLACKKVDTVGTLEKVTASFATSMPGTDLLKLKKLFIALINNDMTPSTQVVTGLIHLAGDQTLNAAVQRTAMELLAEQKLLTVELMRQYNGPASMTVLAATREIPRGEQVAFIMKNVVEGRLCTDAQRSFARNALKREGFLSLKDVRALICCLHNKSMHEHSAKPLQKFWLIR